MLQTALEHRSSSSEFIALTVFNSYKDHTMRFNAYLHSLLSLALTGLASASSQPCLGNCTQNALAFAYEVSSLPLHLHPAIIPWPPTNNCKQYGFPLYAYGRLVKSIPVTPKSNTVYNTRTLATPASKQVVRPNVDTLYTVIFYDLSQSDLVFTTP